MNGGCDGSCSFRNSSCGYILSGDVIYCGCIHCNYDSNTNECSGTCPMNGSFNSANVCLKRIAEPKSDADCVCASCKTSEDANDQILSYRLWEISESILISKTKSFDNTLLSGDRFSSVTSLSLPNDEEDLNLI